MTTQPSLLSQVEAGVAWITLNRTAQRNALDIPTLKNLHALLDEFNADPAVRVVVLTGSGRSFCAGADSRSGLKPRPVAIWKPMAGPKPPTP